MSVIRALRHYNTWRQGDADELLLTPAQIGAAIDAACDDLQRMERDNEAMRAALEWYAQPSNWRRHVVNVGPRISWTNSRAAVDRGGRARVVLMELEAGQ